MSNYHIRARIVQDSVKINMGSLEAGDCFCRENDTSIYMMGSDKRVVRIAVLEHNPAGYYGPMDWHYPGDTQVLPVIISMDVFFPRDD